jgi:radical SAM superfamily enzyme YgiQ (UPF0313 family)
MRILLAQPAPFEPGRLGLENVIWLSEPVALTSLAAMVSEHEVRILDMRCEPDIEFNRVLLEFRPDIVGTTSMTTDCYQAKALLQIAKGTLGPRVFTIVGGHHPTLSPEDFEDEVVDAIALGEGEDTFAELVAHLAKGGSPGELHAINGLRFRDSSGLYKTTPKRHQMRDLDTFPAPARHLVARYAESYFFAVANPVASIATSRGCAFDCNFCAIWEFYEKKTRFLSAKVICDRMEACPEKFVLFLDDNFLTHRKRLDQLCEEIEKRGIKKFWGIQGRTDFIAQNPDVMRRLRDAGLVMVISGFESNDDDNLASLQKDNSRENNRKAAEIIRKLGMLSMGIFMARQDYTEADFDRLYSEINLMGIAMPLVGILTPLPGTVLWKKMRSELLTDDTRLYDLLHSVLPTRLPRETFYKKLAEMNTATFPSFKRGILEAFRNRPDFWLRAIPSTLRYVKTVNHYRPIATNHEHHLRDEIGIIPADVTTATRRSTPRPLPMATAGVSS